MILRFRKRPPHLSSLEREAIILLLTICTKNRKPILACDETHHLLRAAWDLHDDYPVGRYVIMPEHIHLFVGEKILHLSLYRIGSPNGKVMSPAGGGGVAIGRSSNAAFGIDNFLALRRMIQNGFMFGGIPCVMGW